MKVSEKSFYEMYDRVAERLIDKNQCGGGYFNNSREEFDDWAGDALMDALDYCLQYYNIFIDD